MLVTDDFVFVHIPRTGGSFIRAVLRDHLPVQDYEPFSHAPYDELPAQWRNLPAFCVVRNPWDWYVSWFHYHAERGPQRRPSRNPWKQIWVDVLSSGQAGFKEAVTRACVGGFDHPVAPAMRDQGLDYYSALFKTIAGAGLDRPNFSVLRYERFTKQLRRYVRVHAGASRELELAIREQPPMRRSAHRAYPEYYDPELRALVGEKTRWLCERFGYTFDVK